MPTAWAVQEWRGISAMPRRRWSSTSRGTTTPDLASALMMRLSAWVSKAAGRTCMQACATASTRSGMIGT